MQRPMDGMSEPETVMRPWRERVTVAKSRALSGLRPAFTAEDRSLAQNWRGCAVGEQHQLHPTTVRFETTIPADPVLMDLGSGWRGFGGAIANDDPFAAEQFLDAIDDRVLELKREGGVNED